MSGVSLDQLYCPTCGAQFIDFHLYSDPDEFDPTESIHPIRAVPEVPWYVLCPNRHKWTIKTIWRSVNLPDRVQLDRYLGEELP